MRLNSAGRLRTRRGYEEVFVWLGPAFGGLLGLLVGEAVVGQLSADGPVLLPIAALVTIGVLLGGPVLTWLANRLKQRR